MDFDDLKSRRSGLGTAAVCPPPAAVPDPPDPSPPILEAGHRAYASCVCRVWLDCFGKVGGGGMLSGGNVGSFCATTRGFWTLREPSTHRPPPAGNGLQQVDRHRRCDRAPFEILRARVLRAVHAMP